MFHSECLKNVWTVTVILLKYGASVLNKAWFHNHLDHTKNNKIYI